MRRLLCFAFVYCVLAQAGILYAQQMRTEFGKNRVQFHDKFDEWLQYESENYITYWYGEARNIGQAAVLIAEDNYADIQELLEHQMSDKLELVVYTDLSDLKQSNIGADDSFRNQPGRVKIVDNKIFVYFDGDHQDLERQIREGTASVILSSMMFGENLQEIVQNAVLLDIPLWYSEGLVAYCGDNWTVDADERLRQFLQSRPDAEFLELVGYDPRLAGHSWWNYLSMTYGEGTVGNLLYLTRISRSVENAIDYIYAISFEELSEGWEAYYREQVLVDAANRQSIAGLVSGGQAVGSIKNRHKANITQLQLSPDGTRVAYVINEIGKQQVFVEDLATGKRERVLKVGYRNAIQATDYRYPLLSWNPNNTELGIIYERRDVLQFARVYPGTKDKPFVEPIDPQFQRIYAMDYSNSSQLILSGGVRGITDIYKYFIETRQSGRLTDDYYNELEVTRGIVGGMPGIFYTSNRPDTALTRVKLDSVLPTQPSSLFFLPDEKSKYAYPIRLADGNWSTISSPVSIDSQRFSYIDNQSGIANLYTGEIEEYIAYYEQVVYYKDGDVRRLPEDWKPSASIEANIEKIERAEVIRLRGKTTGRTDLESGLDLLDVSLRTGKAIALSQYPNGLNQYNRFRFDSLQLRVPRNTIFAAKQQGKSNLSQSPPSVLPAWLSGHRADDPKSEELKEELVIDEGELFQSEFEEPEIPTANTERAFGLDLLTAGVKSASEENALHAFRPARIRAYEYRVRTDFLTTTFDNQPLFGGLDNFAATPQSFRQQPAGLLVKLNNKELFEDYILELGARFATTFDASEYYGYLDSRKNRLDIRYGFYHGTRRQVLEPAQGSLEEQRVKARSLIALTRFSYPFDVFSSLRATTTLRFDRLTPLLIDDSTIDINTDREQRMGLRLEYVFDNTLDYSLNIKHGSRAKFYGEVAKRFDVELAGEASFNFNEGLLTLIGFDMRHYERVFKHSVFAIRAAAATTLGAEKILFYLGSSEGAIGSSFDQSIPIASGDFAYEMAATHLRGFKTNIRNGNSFAVSNAEFRSPVLRYILPNSKSNFIRQFQLVAFTDVGTAWSGVTPFTRENPINTVTFAEDPSYVLTVNYFRDPVVLGYGLGARVNLFGYFLRLDRAWGVETGQVLDPRWHLSLGLDF
ncbi:MAG: hypothetical protein AB8F78_14330 [Saprospiraceae bacterium]